MKGKMWLGVGLIIFLLLVGLLQMISSSQQDLDEPFHFDSAALQGAKGFRLLLQRVGFEVKQVSYLDETGAGIWIAPLKDQVRQNAEPLSEWIAAGNNLVVLGNSHLSLWPGLDQPEGGWQAEADTDAYYDLQYGAGILRIAPNGHMLCSNQELRQGENAVYVMRILKDFSGQPLFLYQAPKAQAVKEAETLWQLVPLAFWLIIIQAAAALYWWLNAFTRYLGEAKTINNSGELPPEDEDIVALGRLLQRHEQNHTVLLMIYQIFREKIAVRLGVAAHQDNQLLLTQVELDFSQDAELLARVHQLMAQTKISPDDLLWAQQTLYELQERWLNN